ncbi:hypothetical protein M1L60_32125 [Actinoplanes sp. TRM 88003]|uniref:Uncharacterized protein n=1 Tax=Paractinoplanes aksuensis TaxID=2939490 RepID=A0ABT1DWJ4_9ACTN|nr:hypothetical protein [Actinoplanes aksuensis]MCO8275240.1 hypothetical protein [Actinoplanes aksuensis]
MTGPDLSRPEFSSAAAGTDGGVNFYLPRAWAAVADPQGSHPPPPDPVAARGRNDDVTAGLNERIAYWGPFLQLLVYGLGWRRPDLGLARWHDRGLPTDDPVLAVVHRWWGRYVPDVLAWSAHSPYFAKVGYHLNDAFSDQGRDQLHSKWHEAGRTDTRWRNIFGSGDGMHLLRICSARSRPIRSSRADC